VQAYGDGDATECQEVGDLPGFQVACGGDDRYDEGQLLC
jgi:hypothetical protein